MDLETTAASRKNAEMVTHTNDETTWNDMKRHETTWNDMKRHETTWNDYICYNVL